MDSNKDFHSSNDSFIYLGYNFLKTPFFYALSGLKGVQPPLPFGERTRDCSPGHAGKEGPQLAVSRGSQGLETVLTARPAP